MQKIRPLTKKSTEILRFKNLEIMRFFVPCPKKIAVTRSIFEVQGSSFGFSPFFIGSKNDVWQPWLYKLFLEFSFF